MKFDIEQTFRQIMGMKIDSHENVTVGRITFADANVQRTFDCQKKLDDAKDIVQHIRNNWDKKDFDGEEADRMMDEFLDKVR